MARIVAIGQPVNDAERVAIGYLRDHLSNNYTILHNFEITQGAEIFEIDVAILAPHCVFLVDVKGTRGLVDIYQGKWYPEGRAPFNSPLAKLRQHAKALKTLLTDTYPANQDMRRMHLHAAILMTAPDAKVVDHSGLDDDDIVYLNKSATYFQNQARIPPGRSTDIRQLIGSIEKAITGKARPRSAATTYRDWQVEERLGGNDRYTEYRGKHSFMGERGGTARLRVYQVDPYQDEAAREAQRKLISNAFRALANMPGHPNILSIREFFEAEDKDSYVLVIEDVPGQALRQHIKKPELALTFDQKLGIVQDVLTALDHAHHYQVIHRNLTPDAVLVDVDGHARVTGFDYARAGSNRASTIASEIVEDLDPAFQAPECYKDPSQASAQSDLFSAGLVFYELFTGEQAFKNAEELYDLEAAFPVKPSELKSELPSGLDDWLQNMCAFDPAARFQTASDAVQALSVVITPLVSKDKASSPSASSQVEKPEQPPDLTNLPRDYVLSERFVVQERLGHPGGFAVAYKVFDTMGDVLRVVKLVLRDRSSVLERLRQEYKTLVHMPDHPNVAKVIWADRLPDETPYIVFEFVDGLVVDELVKQRALTPDDALTLAQQTATGLSHIHAHGVYHQDIKPSNLLWTDNGVRIIDFNVAVSDRDRSAAAGGTRRYIPPDLDLTAPLTSGQEIDRDLYALGVTFYQCLTGQYPFDESSPPTGKLPRDPRTIAGCEDLSSELVSVLMKFLAPRHTDRFASAQAVIEALSSLTSLVVSKQIVLPMPPQPRSALPDGFQPTKLNVNPFVSYLLTLYSQSQQTNAGTRGLDKLGAAIYVDTLLDRELKPAVLEGQFRLVIISGNAGDGKTAFIQQLESSVPAPEMEHAANGSVFVYKGRTFRSNYDGSQDEGAKVNDDVLLEFLGPFEGAQGVVWPGEETRLIAINEGRLVDFLTDYKERFPRLRELVREGLKGAPPTDGVVIINLNLRSVVADSIKGDDSTFDRLLRRITDPQFWSACASCDLRTRCYIYHNARTFMDPVAGPRVSERLKTLHTVTHLRGRLHITLRDLRSALAFMIAGTHDCDSVHQLYSQGSSEAIHQILNGFYFNSWMGGEDGSKDRLISLLSEIDVGEFNNPDLDRAFDFLAPDAREMGRFAFSDRAHYDDELFRKLHTDLPRDTSGKVTNNYMEKHRRYVAMLRRRHYFERRDSKWLDMLPYTSAEHFIRLTRGDADLSGEVDSLLLSINRGEGLTEPSRLGDVVALRVRQVDRSTIRSYRLFEGDAFRLSPQGPPIGMPFIETLPQSLLLSYSGATGHAAQMSINIDLYEMLARLNSGYKPTIEELQGIDRILAVFKNILASAPYQEVLLTETGYDFYKVRREADGVLSINPVGGGGRNGH